MLSLDLTQCCQLEWIFLDFSGPPAVVLQKLLQSLSVPGFCPYMCVSDFMLSDTLSVEGTLMHSLVPFMSYAALTVRIRSVLVKLKI